ncbi:translation initiation factor 2 subunit alpha (aeIF-2a) [Archaeoglobus sulfaticallidus PM70-1]|uniref:Translation initiation factor 2 subunit alpha n=1 Tax=Archaeoglobus sulfaticallidus PM70-1 TaxID=387631 RepID=N0BJT0_9EURY|nr:translation initiation factor IF-2 subunit alpha [Archaeoglobus sulfaticallidus]AGK60756.1 translation initiation factor 2 subunit alpha (aeIF-2a) [Archaeoglobus sulfaticallidus PM70-1]
MAKKSDEKFIIKRSGYPSKGEIVIGTVTRVLDFGAFVSLDEYENREGLVHISEVAPGWIKDIRDHVKKGQKVVCKVLDTNPKRGHIDLSIKDVNERQRREKVQQWKSEQRAFKWLEIAGEKAGVSKKELFEVGKKLLKEYDTIYGVFEDVFYEGHKAILDIAGEKLAKAIEEIAKENIKPHKVEIRGIFQLKSNAPDGIERIKSALLEINNLSLDGVNIKIDYVGAPKYRIIVESEDYKTAEKALKKAVDKVLKKIKKLGGEGTFEKEV